MYYLQKKYVIRILDYLHKQYSFKLIIIRIVRSCVR